MKFICNIPCADKNKKHCVYRTVGGLCNFIKLKNSKKAMEILSSKTKALLNIKENLNVFEKICLHISLGNSQTKCFYDTAIEYNYYSYLYLKKQTNI